MMEIILKDEEQKTEIEKQKARADEANALIEQLDEVKQKAIYIAVTMFLATKETDDKNGKTA